MSGAMGVYSYFTRRGLGIIAIILAFITTLETVSRLQHRSLATVVSQHIPLHDGSSQTDQDGAGMSSLAMLAPMYVKAILDPKDDEFDRLQCPEIPPKRYEYLREQIKDAKTSDVQTKYFFALDLRQCINILPRLMGSILETIQFLGPENCFLSIVEGNSDDGTTEVLRALHRDLIKSGIKFHLQTSDINPANSDRIEALAALRNLALAPLLNNSTLHSPDTAVIFINDVAICMDDILELIYQRVFQEADMTCAMDWNDIEPAPIFYDIWIARTINGDTFWEIPPDGGWRFASNLFWNHPVSRQRYDEHKAFQVFDCWNGAVVFKAEPLIQNNIRFRRSKPNECYQGEPRLFCKDLWMEGYSRIAVVPSVNLAYSDQSAKKVKGFHGYVSETVKGENEDNGTLKIAWDEKPPEKVKCMAGFADQDWAPWNEGFEPSN